MSACPTCSAENPEGSRFCNQCGARLGAEAAPERKSYTPKHLADKILSQRAAMRGERKRVTVLFCDLKGSTRLAQQAGAEAWHGILDRFFGILGAAVHRYEGTVNQYTGDGIMALFGAPLALEDHAQRACLAALEMQRELRRYADELRLSSGLNLSLRVGLNSGEVIVGAIGDDLRMDYTAQGLTVNLAARLEQICEPGQIYLSRDSARLVEGYFALRDLGRMQVAGLDEPVEVYALEGEGPLKSRLDRSLARGGSPFIGREGEIAQLMAALDKARAGDGQIVSVVGEAGIGKSRLCYEFTQLCADAGFELHRATGVPYGNALPLYPVQTLALSRLGLGPRATPAEVRRLVAGTFLLEHPEHAAALPMVFDFLGAGETSAAAPDRAIAARAQLFELLAHYLPCPSERPLLLLVEDLHFLDGASEQFLAQLCAGVRGHRALLLLNHRPDYDDAWLQPWLDLRIAVSALDARQLAQLARTRLGPDDSLAPLAQQLGARAAGNPYFVEEAVQALADAGELLGSPGCYRLARPLAEWSAWPRLPIPDTVHALLAARIDRLGERDKALLQTASVIGQEFTAAALAPLLDLDAERCESALAALERSGFLLREGSGSGSKLAFRHPLLREVAYGSQLETQRARTHARLAEALLQQYPVGPGGSPAAVRIAHHWQHAGDWARAGEWNLQAARWAGTRDMEISIEQMQLALLHLDRAPDSPQVQHLRIAARAGFIRIAQFTPVDRAAVERAYAEGRQMATALKDLAGGAELLISYGNEQLHRGHADAAVRLHADAVRLCLDNGQGELVQRFRLAILLSHFSAGQPREGIALVDRADEGRWRQEDIGEDNFVSRGFHALMLAWLGQLPRALSELRQVLDYASREERNASWMHAFMVDLAWFSGDYSEALAHARLAMERALATGGPYFHAIAARALAMALSFNGQHAEALEVLSGQRQHVVAGGLAHQFEAYHLATEALVLRRDGRLDEARRTAEAAIAGARRSNSRVWEIYAWLMLLELPQDALPGERALQGLARIEELIDLAAAEGFRPWLLLHRARWCESCAERADWLERAAELFEQGGAPEQARRLRASTRAERTLLEA
ncbi:MAG: adenylate/guanylate cyclase domain-containing protein [Stagnimonas sp.]|nr:adenylate/guanylate cyclase domain-containing protein [Stagnimonas sp.]